MNDYNEYLKAYYRMNILREILMKLPTYEWVAVISGVLDIPQKKEEDTVA